MPLKFEFNSSVNKKTIEWCIDVPENRIGDRACINCVKAGLSCVKEIFKIQVDGKILPKLFSHKSGNEILLSGSSIAQLLRTVIICIYLCFPFYCNIIE